jgi:hypothetical protein
MSSGWGFVGWYYQDGDQKVGPVTAQVIIGLIQAGKLGLDDPVWRGWKVSGRLTLREAKAREALSSGAPP